jgi:D-sedoheptulose 7-phosphate isomerase
MNKYDYFMQYFSEASAICKDLTIGMSAMSNVLASLKGRLFIIGSGGSAANASHAAADFRKLCHIDAIAPYDNIAYLTAVTNDNSFADSIACFLIMSSFNQDDCLMVLSVGGGNIEKGVSLNIVKAIALAKAEGAKVIGIVGPDGGVTKHAADVCLNIEVTNPKFITPIVESMQVLILHCLAFHPRLKKSDPVW